VPLGKILNCTAQPIVSPGTRFPPSETQATDIPLRLHASIRSQLKKGALLLSPPRRSKPSMRVSWERSRPQRVKRCCRQHPPSPEELAALVRGCRPHGGPNFFGNPIKERAKRWGHQPGPNNRASRGRTERGLRANVCRVTQLQQFKQRYFSRSSSSNRCLRQRRISPVILYGSPWFGLLYLSHRS
jgi:hypothetical protein